VRTRASTLLSAFLAAVLLPALPVSAQTAPEEGSIHLEATAGLANYVNSRRPVEMAATLSADVLFVGNLEIQQGSSLIVLPVEVPAGGTKTYRAVVPPPAGNAQTRLRLFATGSDQPVLTRTLQMRVPGEVSLVAIVGTPELAATIDHATVHVTGGEVVTALIGAERLQSGVDPATYLVLSPAVPLPPRVIEWLRAGGRLVIEAAELGGLGLDLAAPAVSEGRANYLVGQGRVVAVNGLARLDSQEWSEVIQPGPMGFAPRDFWDSPDTQLIGAATNAGDQRVPRLPWLLLAVVGYAVLVGPVNFFVLGRIRRRELAWVTVPAVSVLALSGFWIAGRSQLQNTLVNHATVIVGGDHTFARSAVALAVGSAGARTVEVPADWQAYPSSVVSAFTGEAAAPTLAALVEEDGSFRFDLAQLGAAGLHGVWPGSSLALPAITVSSDGPRIQIEVDNRSDFEFWAWGLMATGRVKVAQDSLPSGGRGREAVTPGNPGFNEGTVGDAVINARQMWDDNFSWSRLSPLGATAAGDLGQIDTYFFGFTDDLEVPVSIDGRPYQATGTTLVVIPLHRIDQAGSQVVISQLVNAGNASWIESGPGYLSVATTEMTVGWWLSPERTGDPVLQVSNLFGEFPRRIDAYDWMAEKYVEVDDGVRLSMDRFRSPAGDVLVKASATNLEADVFFEQTMSPYGFSLAWDS
jgi:hypothetical protein